MQERLQENDSPETSPFIGAIEMSLPTAAQKSGPSSAENTRLIVADGSATEQVDVRNDLDDVATSRLLVDIFLADHRISVAADLAAFKTDGWFAIGITDASCPCCGVHRMPGYRKPYFTKNGDQYHYWALVCVTCRKVFEPTVLDPLSQKKRSRNSRFLSPQADSNVVAPFARWDSSYARSEPFDPRANTFLCI